LPSDGIEPSPLRPRRSEPVDAPPAIRAKLRAGGVDLGAPSERGFWQRLPGRNFRRALFLILALGAVLVIRASGAVSFRKLFDNVAPAAPAAPATFQHLEVKVPRGAVLERQ
jgi:hypothetical protein